VSGVLATTQTSWARLSRIGVSFFTLLLTLGIQLFIIVQLMTLVTTPSLHRMRSVYDRFEVVMYGNNTSRMTMIDNQYHRGVEQYFDASNFKKLTAGDRSLVCRIPLSQPLFLLAVLLIWTLTCVVELRKSFDMIVRLLWTTPTIMSMTSALVENEDEDDENVLVIVGLTWQMNTILFSFAYLPRMFVNIVLLWLGTRWIVSSLNFQDLLMNAIALEFLMLLSSMVYAALVPLRNKIETANTQVLAIVDEQYATAWNFLSTFGWGIAGMFWALLYVLVLQTSLPEYKWDVHRVCSDFLSSLTTAGPSATA